MVLSRVGEFRELGEGTSYSRGSVVSGKSICKTRSVCVRLVHTYAYHSHTQEVTSSLPHQTKVYLNCFFVFFILL